VWDVHTHKQTGAPLSGHGTTVTSVTFQPRRAPAASASLDKTVRHWDVRTHAEIGNPMTRHTGYVWSVAFAADGRTLVSDSADKTLRLWAGTRSSASR
jgi:WD40 repeat protein